ncbi:MAG: peptidylprolyl isomerase [Alphaproteobacteria bacterium]|nr:peptidylprolyl isomerase [Alphaproteobacteria bacterium]MBV8549300.1 peptidylprolyl isomerase [Alphaproteobacteria bacterium]
MKKTLLLTTAALLMGAFVVPAFAADASDPVVARVNGDELHRSDVMRELQGLGPQAQQIPPQMLYPQVLQRMIATKIAAQQGYAQKLQNDKEVKEKVKDAEAQIVAETYVRRTVQPKITDAKIKARYDELSTKFKPQEEVRARHILVKTEDEATAIIKQLKDGADFAKLAEEKSEDKSSAKQGGDLNYFPHDAMVKPFADAAFGMKVGEVSDKPVKTEFGYHVIKVEDKRKSSAPPLDEVKDQIGNQLGQEMTNDLIKDLEAKAKVEKFNIDGSPMKEEPKADKK